MTRAATEVATAARPARRPSIDMLRSVAICLMIVVHFVENLAATHDAWSLALNRWMPAGAAAPLFTFLAGVNYRLWCTQRIARGTPPEALSKATIRRGLFLIGTGFAFNVLVWLPADTFNWDVLTFVGLALISLDVVRRMPVSAVAVARSEPATAEAVTTVDDIGAESGRITAVLALQSMVAGVPPGRYGVGAGAASVTVPQ